MERLGESIDSRLLLPPLLPAFNLLSGVGVTIDTLLGEEEDDVGVQGEEECHEARIFSVDDDMPVQVGISIDRLPPADDDVGVIVTDGF